MLNLAPLQKDVWSVFGEKPYRKSGLRSYGPAFGLIYRKNLDSLSKSYFYALYMLPRSLTIQRTM